MKILIIMAHLFKKYNPDTSLFSSAIVKGMSNYNSVIKKKNLLSAEEMSRYIEKCALNNRRSQKKIYSSFYGYAMTVCHRYTNSYDDAVEVLNDGFLKIFKEIHHYKPADTDIVGSFKAWLRKIMVYTAIDHFRKNHKHQFIQDPDDGIVRVPIINRDAPERISYQEIIRSVRELTPGYRIVFNLFVIEGFIHEEVSEQLGISIDTSKANLEKARKQLQKVLFQQNQKHVTIDKRDLVTPEFNKNLIGQS